MSDLTLPSGTQAYCQIWVDRWCFFLVSSGRSDSGVSSYRASLLRFCDFCPDLLTVSQNNVHQWAIDRRKKCGVSTYNREISAIRSFYRWVFASGHCAQDLSKQLPPRLKSTQKLPRVLHEKEVAKLLSEPDISTFMGFRDHVIMRVLYETGIKAHELISLSLGSVHDDGFIVVIQRDGRARDCPISPSLQGLLQKWMMRRREARPGKRQALFVTSRGLQFRSATSVWQVVNRHAHALGLARGYDKIIRTHHRKPWSGHYPHLLRASFAQEMLNKGVDMRSIQLLLGYDSVRSVERHRGLDLPTLKAASDKLPRNAG